MNLETYMNKYAALNKEAGRTAATVMGATGFGPISGAGAEKGKGWRTAGGATVGGLAAGGLTAGSHMNAYHNFLNAMQHGNADEVSHTLKKLTRNSIRASVIGSIGAGLGAYLAHGKNTKKKSGSKYSASHLKKQKDLAKAAKK